MFGDGRICVVWVGQVMSCHLRTTRAVLDKSKHGRGRQSQSLPFETGQESRNVSQEEFAYAVWVRSMPILPRTESTNRANGIPDTATELR